jgi:small subunit ribosomal protein S6
MQRKHYKGKKGVALYEAMFIVRPELNDSDRNKAYDDIQEVITSAGGKIMKTHQWGKRRLEYKLDIGEKTLHSDGYYYIAFFEAPTASILGMDAKYKMSQSILRSMILRAEKIQETIEFKPLQQGAAV